MKNILLITIISFSFNANVYAGCVGSNCVGTQDLESEPIPSAEVVSSGNSTIKNWQLTSGNCPDLESIDPSTHTAANKVNIEEYEGSNASGKDTGDR